MRTHAQREMHSTAKQPAEGQPTARQPTTEQPTAGQPAATADEPAAAQHAAAGGFMIRRREPQHGYIEKARGHRVYVRWNMGRTARELHGRSARPLVSAHRSEVLVTTGLAGSSPARPDERYAEEQAVVFHLDKDFYVPPPGQPLIIPDGFEIIDVTQPDGEPLLVELTGELFTWCNAEGNSKGGWGRIMAANRDGRRTPVSVEYNSILGPGDEPLSRHMMPATGQRVRFTCVTHPRFRRLCAQQVRALDGGPVAVVTGPSRPPGLPDPEEAGLADMEG